MRQVAVAQKKLESAFGVPNCTDSAACFLTALGAEEAQIDASLCEAIRTAKEQRSISLATRSEATYAEYRRQKSEARQEDMDSD